VGCSDETVRKVIKAFNQRGLAVLKPGSRRPHKIRAAFHAEQAEQLKELMRQSPQIFGKPTSVWTCELAAEVSFEQELIQERVSGETIRAALKRMGVKWARAKYWITSPDRNTRVKKASRPARNDLLAWKVLTSRAFSLRMFPGDHFFIRKSQYYILQVIARELNQFLE
jgi:transposase